MTRDDNSDFGRGPSTQEVENVLPVRDPTGAAWVEVVRGPDKGMVTQIGGRLLRIGVDPLCDLVLSDPTASRRHCEIEVRASGFLLQDLGSTNGTYVDELRVREVYLEDGVQVQVGNSLLVFHAEAPDAIVRAHFPTSSDRRIIGRSSAIQNVFDQILKVAPTDLSVIIEGETGTGKELVASAVHTHSNRRDKPFVVFDCSAFPPTLIESELFGHEKGAFSGAIGIHKGVFERADGGTIFFDELGEMDTEFQAKFLRALESGEIRRVGGERTFKVDVRVVAATNRKLEHMVADGSFRQDLFYRFAKVRLELPPLRERAEDIPLLAEHFLNQCAPTDTPIPVVTDRANDVLCAYPWPGNVRELRNMIERTAALCDGGRITADFLRRELGLEERFKRAVTGVRIPAPTEPHEHLLPEAGETSVPLRDAKEQIIADFEKRYLLRLLEKHQQNVSRAAREAKVDRRHFYRLLKKYGLMEPQGEE